MNIEHQDNGQKGSFFVAKNGEKLAEMVYTWAGSDRIIIEHTEVSDALRGKGAGEKMVRKAVDFAREKKIAIIPLCPFAKSVFDRRPELSDVL